MEQCIRDAIFHLDCAKQALEASLTDPEKWKQESTENAKMILQLFPVMIALSLSLPQTRTHSDPGSAENLQESLEESQST